MSLSVKLLPALLLAATLSAAPDCDARSRSAVAEFKRQQPCPSTGAPRGACPGWVVDHIRPLCAGGEDRPSNMQWQTRRDAALKDRQEHAECRLHWRLPTP